MLRLLAIAIPCWLLVVTPAALAVPHNDNFADAIDVPPGVNVLYGPTVNGTKEPGEPDFSSEIPVRNSIWWKFTAQQTGPVVLATYCGCRIQYFVDVFKNNSFNLSNRIASALADPKEYGEATIVHTMRLVFNVQQGKTYHIRAGGLPYYGPASYNPVVKLNIRRLPTAGGTFVISGEMDSGLIIPPVASGDQQPYLLFQPFIFMIGNASSLARSLQVSSTIADLHYVAGSPTVPAISGGKPGFTFVVLGQQTAAHANKVGHWKGNVTFTLSSSGPPTQYSFVYDIYRSAPIITSVKLKSDQTSVTAALNRTVHITGEVTNTGSYTAHYCNLRFDGSAVAATWHATAPDEPAGQPFSLAPKHSRKFEIAIRPQFVGGSTFYVMATCAETAQYGQGEWVSVHFTGTR